MVFLCFSRVKILHTAPLTHNTTLSSEPYTTNPQRTRADNNAIHTRDLYKQDQARQEPFNEDSSHGQAWLTFLYSSQTAALGTKDTALHLFLLSAGLWMNELILTALTIVNTDPCN